jgi:hypothetical protein
VSECWREWAGVDAVSCSDGEYGEGMCCLFLELKSGRIACTGMYVLAWRGG